MMLISVTEYAKLHDRNPDTIRQRILRGVLPAVKIGNQWVIDSETPLTDNRIKQSTEQKKPER